MKAALALFCIALQAADFHNVAHEAGLTKSFPNGGDTSKKYIVETTGSGLAWIDYDNDGLPDLFIVSGPGATNRMYHNQGHGHFADVTEKLGLTHTGWGQGVCAGDYDNDGFTDIFVTYYGQNVLYHNEGGKHFEDVTKAANLGQERARYNTGCAFIDYDRDGKLDLFVANYLKFEPGVTPLPGENPYCFYRGIAVACGPRGLPFDHNLLYHNEGRAFRDVSETSGIAAPEGHYALGVITGDFNGDGWPDLYVACDQTPSLLYINQRNGTFTEEATERGVAFDENGRAMSGMGVTASGTELFRTNFSDERSTLYRGSPKGDFEDVSRAAGMGNNTSFVGWGCGFFDFDNDGLKDVLLVNGHVFPEVERLHAPLHFREPAVLYRGIGQGRYEDVSSTSGTAIREPHAARGAAFADYDNDGAVEIAINNQNETPSLLRQSKTPAGHWITLRLEGTKSNRSGIGALVTVTAGGRTQTDEVRSGGSYLSQNDLRLHFGLGAATLVDALEVKWPSGTVVKMQSTKVDRILDLKEGQ